VTTRPRQRHPEAAAEPGLGRWGLLVCPGSNLVGWPWLCRLFLPPDGLPVVASRPLADAAEEGDERWHQQLILLILCRAGETFAQVCQCCGEEPGNVHLGYAYRLADLGLGHVPVKPHRQDALLTFG